MGQGLIFLEGVGGGAVVGWDAQPMHLLFSFCYFCQACSYHLDVLTRLLPCYCLCVCVGGGGGGVKGERTSPLFDKRKGEVGKEVGGGKRGEKYDGGSKKGEKDLHPFSPLPLPLLSPSLAPLSPFPHPLSLLSPSLTPFPLPPPSPLPSPPSLSLLLPPFPQPPPPPPPFPLTPRKSMIA